MSRAALLVLLLIAPTAHGQAPPPAGWERTTIQSAPVFQTLARLPARGRGVDRRARRLAPRAAALPSYGEICATDRFVIVSAGGSAFIRR